MDSNFPYLLLLSGLGVAVSVVFIALAGVTGAGWAMGLALLALVVATAAVVAAVSKMLGNADRA
jgi:hypothetical protein